MWYPHKDATFQNTSAKWDGLAFDGIEFGESVPIKQCHITPLSASAIFSKFGTEETKGFLLMAPLTVAIEDFALLAWGGQKYKATLKKEYRSGTALDHLEMFLELVRG